MPYAVCLTLYALRLMHYALCLMPYAFALCLMRIGVMPTLYALCPMHYAVCLMLYALCPTPYALCLMPYARCLMPRAFCPTRYAHAICPMPYAYNVAIERFPMSGPGRLSIINSSYKHSPARPGRRKIGLGFGTPTGPARTSETRPVPFKNSGRSSGGTGPARTSENQFWVLGARRPGPDIGNIFWV